MSEDIKQLIREIHGQTVTQKSPSRSFMATDGAPVDTPLGIEWNTDGNAWTLVMTEAYRLNVPLAVTVVEDIAKNGPAQTSWAGSESFNQWLRDFGKAYCQGLVAEKQANDGTAASAAPVGPSIPKEPIPVSAPNGREAAPTGTSEEKSIAEVLAALQQTIASMSHRLESLEAKPATT